MTATTSPNASAPAPARRRSFRRGFGRRERRSPRPRSGSPTSPTGAPTLPPSSSGSRPPSATNRPPPAPLDDSERAAIEEKLGRLGRRREQLGPVNPLAEREYEQALAHVEDLETQRVDLETALAELQSLIRDTDRKIHAAFEETFEATERNFEELVEHLFPGGRGRLRLVDEGRGPSPVLGGAEAPPDDAEPQRAAPEEEEDEFAGQGVEIEVTPAGKATRRLSLLSGGEKALVALAFVFSVFLARPSPFYILDEVEAALDDANIDRFLQLVDRFSDRAQFIIVTHQKRTMDAADVLYGVSMGKGGVTKVVSRRFEGAPSSRARRGRRGRLSSLPLRWSGRS